MFFSKFAALNEPADKRITSPILMPSVRYEPAARVMVQAPAVPAMVIEAPVVAVVAVQAFFNAAAMKAE